MRTLRVCLIGTLFMLGAVAAQAADIVVLSEDAPPPAYDWSGFFVGLNGGDGFAADQTLRVNPNPEFHGLFGGAQIGANWQSGKWVVGAEADLQLADIVDSDRSNDGGQAFKSEANIDSISTVRIRSGLALDNLLLYGTGGLAMADVDHSIKTIDDPASSINWNNDYRATGWTAGAGVEWGFSANSSAKIEYLYTDLGKKDLGSSLLGDDSYIKATPGFQSIRMGVDFRF